MSKSEEMIQLKVAELDAMTPTQVLEDTRVENKFVMMYNNIHGTDKGELMYNKEKANYLKLISENSDLSVCSRASIYLSFLDIAINGLSLDNTGGKPHCYLTSRNCKKKGVNGQKDTWEKRVVVSVSGYGELTMRMRAGQIKYADNPVVVFEGDTFLPEIDNISGVKKITYKAAVPRLATAKVIGCFIRIVRNDNSVDYQWLLEGDIDRLKGYSEKNNGYWDNEAKRKVPGDANELYSSHNGSIDPGFLEAKMLKHAFDAFPKVRTGNFTELETQVPEQPVIDYGLEDAEHVVVEDAKIGFGEEQHTPPPTPVLVEADNEEGF